MHCQLSEELAVDRRGRCSESAAPPSRSTQRSARPASPSPTHVYYRFSEVTSDVCDFSLDDTISCMIYFVLGQATAVSPRTERVLARGRATPGAALCDPPAYHIIRRAYNLQIFQFLLHLQSRLLCLPDGRVLRVVRGSGGARAATRAPRPAPRCTLCWRTGTSHCTRQCVRWARAWAAPSRS